VTRRALAALAGLMVAGASQGRAQALVVQGTVTADGGAPLVNAVVAANGEARLSDNAGRYTIAIPRAERVAIRARRIGFYPRDTVIVVPAGLDTVRVDFRLARVAIALPPVRTTAVACRRSQTGLASTDSVLVVVLEQLQENARTYVTLAVERPFRYDLERTESERVTANRDFVIAVDTVHRLPLLMSRYEPGQAVYYVGGMFQQGAPVRAVTKLPELPDFADTLFIKSHCFTYAGVEDVNGVATVRIDFEPDEQIKGADIAGSMYLDTASYLIRRAVMELRNLPPEIAGTVSGQQATTDFKEAFAGVPIISRVTATTTMAGRRGQNGILARVEVQLLIKLVVDR
jgi:hypothetical protein